MEKSFLNSTGHTDTDDTRPTVISTAAKRSGEISRLNGIGCITAGDLSTLSFNRITTHHFPYRHVPPLEMTQRQAAYLHLESKRLAPVPPASLSFRRSEAEWRNLPHLWYLPPLIQLAPCAKNLHCVQNNLPERCSRCFQIIIKYKRSGKPRKHRKPPPLVTTY